jgi:hypothetical protein
MGRFRIGVNSLRIVLVIVGCSIVLAADCAAEEVRFADWVAIQKTDAASNEKSRQIGTFAADGISTLWLSDPDIGGDNIELTLKSKKKIVSVYFSYRIDSVDTLAIRSAIKECESNCLIDFIPKNGELIRTMKKGLKIRFEYDTYPDTAQKPTFSLKGFSKAYGWLLGK